MTSSDKDAPPASCDAARRDIIDDSLRVKLVRILACWSEVSMAVSLHGPAILRPSLQRLDELSRLEDNWDTYGAFPPAPAALDATETIMRQVIEQFGVTASDCAAPYTVMPIADGGLQLEWRGPSATLELDIGPAGELSALLVEQVSGERRFAEHDALSQAAAFALIGRVLAP
jgi:hypothetical protein